MRCEGAVRGRIEQAQPAPIPVTALPGPVLAVALGASFSSSLGFVPPIPMPPNAIVRVSIAKTIRALSLIDAISMLAIAAPPVVLLATAVVRGASAASATTLPACGLSALMLFPSGKTHKTPLGGVDAWLR